MLKENYDFLQKTVLQQSGIVLAEDKMYLINARFRKLRLRYQLNDDDQIINEIKNKSNPNILGEVINVMTNNETSFFRDKRYFDDIKNAFIPNLIKNRRTNRKLKIWSAAVSRGQEAYSLAFIMHEMKSTTLGGWNIQIIGTDLCSDAIEKAQNGTYSQFEVQRGLPIEMLIKHFEKKDDDWVIREHVKKMIVFKVHNLLKNYAAFGLCDIILCRNVLIYFNEDTKIDILRRLSRCLNSDGFLVLGSTDMVARKVKELKPWQKTHGVYQLASSG